MPGRMGHPSRPYSAAMWTRLAIVSSIVLALSPATAKSGHASDMGLGLSELRLGIFDQGVDGPRSESGVAVNVEALLTPLGQPSGAGMLDVLLRPRPMLGATVNTQGDTSLAYAGLTWTVPLLTDRLFAEASFGGAIHDGPLDAQGLASYGCSWAFRESVSLGISLGEGWQILGTVEHMSNADLCARNRGLTNAGVRLGYRLD